MAHPIPPLVNIAPNLQYKDHPQANQAVLDALEASTRDWLTAPQWLTLFENAQLFDRENSFDIPAEVEGLYRVDNNHMEDRNTWVIRSAQSSCSQGNLYFKVRHAVGQYRFDNDWDIIMDADVHGGRTLIRKTVRYAPMSNVTFVHYRFVWLEE